VPYRSRSFALRSQIPDTDAAARIKPLIHGMRWMLFTATLLVLGAGLDLFVFPEATDTMFAWSIQPALTAAFLGATAIRPGRFNVLGTLVAIFFLAFTISGLSLAGVESWINDVFTGGVLFLAVVISTVSGRRRAESN